MMKRKDPPSNDTHEQTRVKKAKKHKSEKGGHRRGHESSHSSKEFIVVESRMGITIPPLYSGPGRPRQAVEEMLDSMLMKHIPDLRGVVLAHSNLQFVSSTATVLGDSPFTRVDISFDATVWSPKIGSRLHGTISISSPDHIALLVHGIFNVSIPRHHIPVDKWVFEYGPSENDPEYGPNAAMTLDEAQENEGEQEENGGRWVDKERGKPLGGKRKSVKFTVIGYTISHGMLSLLGSLQPDPFSPLHQPLPATSTSSSKKNKRNSAISLAEEESIEDILMQEEAEIPEEPFTREAPDSGAEFGEADDDLDEQSDRDNPLAPHGKETDELFRRVTLENKEKKVTKEKEKEKKKQKQKEKSQRNDADADAEVTQSKKRKKEDKEARRKRRQEGKLANATANTKSTNLNPEGPKIGDTLEEPKKKKKKRGEGDS